MITLVKSIYSERYLWCQLDDVSDPMSRASAIANGVWKYKIQSDELNYAMELLNRYKAVVFLHGKVYKYE